jgi:hypothetical protein
MANNAGQFSSVVSHLTKAKTFGLKVDTKRTEKNYRELVHPDDKRLRVTVSNFFDKVEICCTIGRVGGDSVSSRVVLPHSDDKDAAFLKVRLGFRRAAAKYRKNQEKLFSVSEKLCNSQSNLV